MAAGCKASWHHAAWQSCWTTLFFPRCVSDRQKSFALGIQWIVVRTLGTVQSKVHAPHCYVFKRGWIGSGGGRTWGVEWKMFSLVCHSSEKKLNSICIDFAKRMRDTITQHRWGKGEMSRQCVIILRKNGAEALKAFIGTCTSSRTGSKVHWLDSPFLKFSMLWVQLWMSAGWVCCIIVDTVPGAFLLAPCVLQGWCTGPAQSEDWFYLPTGGIPGPIAFGSMIDKSCLLWQDQCGDQGSCYVYQNSAMSRYTLITGLVYKVRLVFHSLIKHVFRRQHLMLGGSLTELCYARLPPSKAKLHPKTRNILRKCKSFSSFSAGNGAPGTVAPLNSHYIPGLQHLLHHKKNLLFSKQLLNDFC